MAIKQTISELTDYKYSELIYNTAKSLIIGLFMEQVCDLLNKSGASVNETDTYDASVEKAVSEFQQKNNLAATGILDTDTWQSMIASAEEMPNSITTPEEPSDENEGKDQSDSPHYNSFFDEDKNKTHRRNRKDIVIQFGNKTITKTIKDVYMRNVTVEVDTSGNPIFEIYEFIGRDIKESDEASDSKNYTSENEPTSSSDIKYNFNFVTPPKNQTGSPTDAAGGGGGGGGGSSW